MRLLSQFGEIDYYKSLKYDGQGLGLPNIALVVYKDEEGAKNCFRGSPVRFRMGKVKAGGQSSRTVPVEQPVEETKEEDVGSKSSVWGQGAIPPKKGPLGAPFGLELDTPHQRRYISTSSLPKPTPRPIRMPFDPPSPPDAAAQQHEDEDRIFQVHTSRTHRNFRDQINMGHYHGGFAIDGKMFGQEDLVKRVPTEGLSCVDWRARERPWRFVRRESEGRGRRERLGVLWEREGKGKREEVVGRKVDALGDVEGGSGRKKWGMSWSDVGIS